MVGLQVIIVDPPARTYGVNYVCLYCRGPESLQSLVYVFDGATLNLQNEPLYIRRTFERSHV